MSLEQVSTTPTTPPQHASANPDRAADALASVEAALRGETTRFGLAPPHGLAVSLRELESALLERAADLWLEETAPGSLESARRIRAELCELGCRAEVLGVAVATGTDLERAKDEVRGLIARARRCLDRERDAVLDAWWVDVGVGD